MEIMLNGQLVTCTPDEYARLIQLGLIPGASSGTRATEPSQPDAIPPLNGRDPVTGLPVIDEFPKLPDDYTPLPEQYPRIGDSYPDWLKNGTQITALYGCISSVSQIKPIGESTQTSDILSESSNERKRIEPINIRNSTYFLVKRDGRNEYLSSENGESLTDDREKAFHFGDCEDAIRIARMVSLPNSGIVYIVEPVKRDP